MNNVSLRHEDPQMIARAKAAILDDKFLNEFIPCPPELKVTPSISDDPEEKKKELERIQNNTNKYGHGDWYSFCINEWGTKWDIYQGNISDDTDPNSVTFSFDSAWSPPITAYEKLMDMGFTVRATYYEPGMCYCGIWEDGDDDYYDYNGMSADEVEANIPSDLDYEYGISEQLRDWENEQEEDEE
jgi:hypothetical protein